MIVQELIDLLKEYPPHLNIKIANHHVINEGCPSCPDDLYLAYSHQNLTSKLKYLTGIARHMDENKGTVQLDPQEPSKSMKVQSVKDYLKGVISPTTVIRANDGDHFYNIDTMRYIIPHDVIILDLKKI